MNLQAYKSNVLPLKNKLFRFALKMIHSVAEAEDIVQEVMIKVWDQRDSMKEIKNIEAWCVRLTKNLTLDKIKSKHSKTQSFAVHMELETSKISPHKQTELNDSMNKIKQLIQNLPEKQRQIIQLRDIEEFSYQEITEALGITIDQVKVNLFRARKTIRAQFKNTNAYGL